MIQFRQKEFSPIRKKLKLLKKVTEDFTKNPGNTTRKVIAGYGKHPSAGIAYGVGSGVDTALKIKFPIYNAVPGVSVSKAAVLLPTDKMDKKIPKKVRIKLRKGANNFMDTSGNSELSRAGNKIESGLNNIYINSRDWAVNLGIPGIV